MPYDSTTGRITAPLNTDDVCQALGITGVGDVGTLCTHPYINMWSANKPVVCDTPGLLTDSQRAAANYGISILAIPITGLTSDKIVNATWTYNAPTGTNYKRLADFEGYDAWATPPYRATFPTEAFIGDSFDIVFNQSMTTGSLSLKDAVKCLGTISGIRVGVMVEQGSTVKYYTGPEILNVTGSTDVQQQFAVSVPNAAASQKCTLFLTTKAAANGALDTSAGVYPFFPGTTKQATVTAKAKAGKISTLTITQWNSVTVPGFDTVRFTATVKNNGSTAGYFNYKDILLDFAIEDKTYGAIVWTDHQPYWSAFTTVSPVLQPGETTTVSLEFKIEEFLTTRTWTGTFSLWVENASGSYNRLGGSRIGYPAPFIAGE